MAKPTRLTREMVQEYVRQGYWTETTTLDWIESYAREIPLTEAVIGSGTRLNWAEVDGSTDRLASAFLDAGLEKDDVVLVQLPNHPEAFLLRVALKKAGLLGAYVPVVWRQAEVERALQRLGAQAMVVPAEFRGFGYLKMARALRAGPGLRHLFVVGGGDSEQDVCSLDRAIARDRTMGTRESAPPTGYGPFEVSLIAASSGSTGNPKLCEWPEAAQVLAGRALAARLGLTRSDVTGIFAPLGGGAGTMAWLAALAVGSKTVLADSFEGKDLLALIEAERVTFVGTVPAILIRILECPSLSRYDLSSLRLIRTGTAALVPSVAREAEARLRATIVPAAGSMETITFAQTGSDDPPEIRLGGFVGRVLLGGEAKVVDETGEEVTPGEVGELLIRGAYTSSGYYRDPKATIEAWGELGPGGWFRTGDLARMDPRGNIMIVGRKRDVIVRGGYKVYPAEIESLLSRHPKVREAAIVGIPDPVLGETVCACVIPRPGAEPTLEEITGFLREQRIAAYKLPARLLVVPEFPRLESDKVDKRRLIQEVARAAREAS